MDMDVGIGGDKWPAAELFCSYISMPANISFFSDVFRNKSIIDLGSGTGITSILIDQMYEPSEVVITDLESHVPHINYNISLNSSTSRGVSVCNGVTLDWFQPDTLNRKFDVIIAFECVYNELLYEPFIKSLAAVSTCNSIIFLGLTRLFARPAFFHLLICYGFDYMLIPQDKMPQDYHRETTGRDVGLFVITYKKG